MLTRHYSGVYRMDVELGGYVRFDVQLTNSPHRHSYFELCLALAGSGNYRHGGKVYALYPGTVFLAEPGVTHEITSFETKDLELYFVTMRMARIDQAGAPADPILSAFENSRRVCAQGHDLLARYVPLLAADSPERGFARETLLRLFALEMMQALTGASAPATLHADDTISRAIAWIEINIERTFGVIDVARHLGLSERTLRRHFARRAGINLSEEIRHRRMRRAAHRLLMGFSVRESGESVGIDDPTQFARSFKRAFGQGPKQFQSTYQPGSLASTTRPSQETLSPGHET